MTAIDELLRNAEKHAGSPKGLALPPARKLVVIACMDARVSPWHILDLQPGDAHVIRNAGGVVTPDVRRSLVISQRLLGTKEIMLIHHTDCGMLTFTDDKFRADLQAATGIKPDWPVDTFSDLDEDLRQQAARIHADPLIPNKNEIRGFVYEVESGRLREVKV